MVKGGLLEMSEELIAKRTEKSKTFRTDKPRTFRVRAYGGPMHYKDAGGNWQDIDLALEDVNPGDPGYAKGYRKKCVKTKIGVYLKPDVSEDNAIAAEYDGAKIGFGLKSVAYLDIASKDYSILSQASTVAPVVGQKDIAWENVLPQVDYKFMWGKARGKIEIVLKQNNLPDPADYGYDPAKTYLVFIEKIETNLKTWIDKEETGDCETEDRLDLKTAAQELKYLLPVGTAIDANGEAVRARHRIVRKGGNTYLLVGIPYSWLKDSQRQWPIVVDPTYQSTTADGYVSCSNADWATCRTAGTGVGASSNGAGSSLGISATPDCLIYHSFFYFDTSAIPGAAGIDSVDLKIYGYLYASSDVSAQKGTQADPLTTADFDAFVGTTGEGDPDGREYGHVAWSLSGWNTISFNQTGKEDIEKDGTTKICCREYTHDYSDSSPSADFLNGLYYAEGSGKEPYLDIEYTEPPTFIPRIIII